MRISKTITFSCEEHIMIDNTTADEPNALGLGKAPIALKLLGALCAVAGLSTVAEAGFVAHAALNAIRTGILDTEYTLVTQVCIAVGCALFFVVAALLIVLGVRLLQNKRRGARIVAEAVIVATVGQVLCLIMLFGMSGYLIVPGIILAAEIALLSYIDPSLSEERELQRKLRDMETRASADEGTLGRDETGRGYIKLDFFNLFWIFVVCSLVGIATETVYVFALDGCYQNRTGMLWGPFSPICGFGAVLMTIALNRFHDRSPVAIFL